MAILTPSLVKLRSGFDLLAPGRDRESDGWIGNLAHQQYPSGHNPDESGNAERQDADRIDEVRAVDVDKDLRVPGLTMQQCVRKTLDTARDRRRLIYIIWNRTIWSASNGWQPRAYTGANAHTQHAHYSGHPDYDNDTAPWGIEELIDMSLTPAQRKELVTEFWQRDTDPDGNVVEPAWVALNGARTDARDAKAGVVELRADVAEVKALIGQTSAPVLDYDRLAEALLRRIANPAT